MPSPTGKTFAPSLQPALELIYLATLQPELAGQSLRKLLLANPNYFGTLSENSFKAVLNISGDTRYETLGCVSYIPLLEQLYASIKIKQEHGYSFYIGDGGSREYVRFYLSYDRGATWVDKGLAAVNVCDEPGAKTRVHLVTRKINLRGDAKSSEESPLVRAILSWNSAPPPDAPDWTPLWGNAVKTQIQLVKPDARRKSGSQTGSWVQYAGETVSKRSVERTFDSADVRPVVPSSSTGLNSDRRMQLEEYQPCAV